MIKIKRDSWHYRLVDNWTDNRPPRDVCSYVRKLILALFVWTVIGGFAVAVTGFLLVGLYANAAMLFFDVEYSREDIMMVAAISTAAVSLFGLVLIGYHYMSKWNRTRKDKAESKEKGLVRTFYEDKKSKMCSYIDFE